MPRKTVKFYLAQGEPCVSECPTCGHQSLVTIPVYGLGMHGVSPLRDFARCVECDPYGDEEGDDAS